MFNWFKRPRQDARSAKSRSLRPTLESLEARDCPSTISLAVSSYAANKHVTLSGDVTNTASPAGLTVQLTGAASGTATTDCNGHFSTTVTATALDAIFASTTDGQSNTAQVFLVDMGPSISKFSVASYSHDMYLFTGTVMGFYQGETVKLGGMVAATDGMVLNVNSDNSFSLAIQLTGPDNTGSVTAQATDWWGLTSTIRTVWISNAMTLQMTDPSGVVTTYPMPLIV